MESYFGLAGSIERDDLCLYRCMRRSELFIVDTRSSLSQFHHPRPLRAAIREGRVIYGNPRMPRQMDNREFFPHSGKLMDRLTDVSKPCCVERIPGTSPVRVLVSNIGDGSLQLVEVSAEGKLKSLGRAEVGKAPKRIAFLPLT